MEEKDGERVIASSWSSWSRSSRLRSRLLPFALSLLAATAHAATGAERSFVALKPETVERGLVGHVIERFERRGLKLAGMKLLRPSEELMKAHYAEHAREIWFPGMLERFCQGSVVAMVVEGENAVKAVRAMVGCTNPVEADSGSIRGELSTSISRNMVHASDSQEAARREISIWFQEGELLDACSETKVR